MFVFNRVKITVPPEIVVGNVEERARPVAAPPDQGCGATLLVGQMPWFVNVGMECPEIGHEVISVIGQKHRSTI